MDNPIDSIKKIKKLLLILENCEDISIPYECVRHIKINNVKTSFIFSVNKLSIDNYVDSLTIYLKDFNDIRDKIVFNSFEGPITDDGNGKGETLRKRLFAYDITSIILIFEDDTSCKLIVPWEGKNFNNLKQSVKYCHYNKKPSIVISFQNNDIVVLFKRIYEFYFYKIRGTIKNLLQERKAIKKHQLYKQQNFRRKHPFKCMFLW